METESKLIILQQYHRSYSIVFIQGGSNLDQTKTCGEVISLIIFVLLCWYMFNKAYIREKAYHLLKLNSCLKPVRHVLTYVMTHTSKLKDMVMLIMLNY